MQYTIKKKLHILFYQIELIVNVIFFVKRVNNTLWTKPMLSLNRMVPSVASMALTS